MAGDRAFVLPPALGSASVAGPEEISRWAPLWSKMAETAYQEPSP